MKRDHFLLFPFHMQGTDYWKVKTPCKNFTRKVSLNEAANIEGKQIIFFQLLILIGLCLATLEDSLKAITDDC